MLASKCRDHGQTQYVRSDPFTGAAAQARQHEVSGWVGWNLVGRTSWVDCATFHFRSAKPRSINDFWVVASRGWCDTRLSENRRPVHSRYLSDGSAKGAGGSDKGKALHDWGSCSTPTSSSIRIEQFSKLRHYRLRYIYLARPGHIATRKRGGVQAQQDGSGEQGSLCFC